MTLPPFPAPFAANVAAYGGEGGKRWLARLPTLVAAAVRHWRIECLAPLPNLSFNYLASGRRDGDGVVVKFIWEQKALTGEAGWLALQRNRGAVRLRDWNGEFGALLMDRLLPGTPATDLPERDATAVLGTLIAALTRRKAAGVDLPSIASWFADLPGFVAQPPPGIGGSRIDAARGIADELAGSAPSESLLHGDLHHDNVIAGSDGWRVIDPKGVTGDPAHECAAMLRNGLSDVAHRALPRLVGARLEILADCTGFEPARIAGWGYAQTVLACCWSVMADPRSSVARELAVADALRLPCR